MKLIFKCTHASCAAELAIDEDAVNPDNPKVRCSNCNRIVNLKEILKELEKTRHTPPPVDKDEILAWLVVHDEKASKQTFSMKSGKYLVGRKNQSMPGDVMIDCNDPYMSRNHCVIEVRRNPKGFAEVLIADNKSTNGTWLNAEQKVVLKENEKIFLEENDMLQLGMTKVIVKIKQGDVKSQADASTEVYKKPYGKTKILDF